MWCFLWFSLSIFINNGIPLLILIYVLSTIFIWKLSHTKFDIAVSAYLFSVGLSYSLLYIAIFFVSFIFTPFLNIEYTDNLLYSFDEPVYLLFYTFIAGLQFLFAYLLFRIKRFKAGFPFLLEKYSIILSLIVAGIVLLFVSWISIPRTNYPDSFDFLPFYLGILITGVGIIIWIRRGIKAFYIRKMKEHNTKTLEQELAEKERECQRLIEQNKKLGSESHKIRNRLSTLERAVIIMSQSAYSTDFSEELAFTIEDIKRLSQDYQNGISKIEGKKPLPSSKIKMIDDLFEYFATKCAEHKIDFHLTINGSIPYMIENIIPQNKLEIMIGDHLQNAIIAVNSSENSFRSILVILGVTGDFYELTVYDSGIPFEIDTLQKLGTEQTTTHSDSGGSGIGFMTTFAAVKECKASLVINEIEPNTANFSKSVSIYFDGKNEYKIQTYRAECFSFAKGKTSPQVVPK